MKAAVITSATATPVYTEFADPEPAPGHQIVDLVAAGIHNVVRSRASGQHYSASNAWPLVPGVDAVARTAAGDLVYTGMVTPPWGTMAQRMSIPDAFALPLPADTDPRAAAAGANPGLASWIPLRNRHTALGDTGLGAVLIIGATGMAGHLAVDHALHLGATRVVAAGRNRDVLARLRAERDDRVHTVALTGGDEDINGIRAGFDGAAPSTVVDFLWGPVAEHTFQALAPLAENTEVAHIEVGAMAGQTARVSGALLRSRRYTLSGSGLGSVDPADLASGISEFIALVNDGSVRVPYVEFALSDVARAWAHTGPERAVVVG